MTTERPAIDATFPGTWAGPPIDDPDILERLAGPLRAVIEPHNGFILQQGAVHVRGACTAPAWHSLRHAWEALVRRAATDPRLDAEDVPFAEDALGRQYLLRDHDVLRWVPGSGEVAPLGVSLGRFLLHCERSAAEFLDLAEWVAYEAAGGVLPPGDVLVSGTGQTRRGDEPLRGSSAATNPKLEDR